MKKQFTLTEKILLLALDNNSGCIKAGTYWNQIDIYMIGTTIIDLQNEGIININNNYITITNDKNVKHSHYIEVLKEIKTLKKPSLKTLFYNISNKYWFKEYSKVIIEELVNENVLKKERGKFLLLFPFDKFINTNQKDEQGIIQQMRSSALSDEELPEETKFLIYILDKIGILYDYFSKYELKQVEQKFKQNRKELSSNKVLKLVQKYLDNMTAIATSTSVLGAIN